MNTYTFKKCPVCGEEYISESKYCPKCGIDTINPWTSTRWYPNTTSDQTDTYTVHHDVSTDTPDNTTIHYKIDWNYKEE